MKLINMLCSLSLFTLLTGGLLNQHETKQTVNAQQETKSRRGDETSLVV